MSRSTSENASMLPDNKPVLDVKDLHVHFAHESGSLHAVRGLGFSLHAGESLAIVGESGSGKSASAMAIMGLHPQSARVQGSIKLHGEQLLDRDDQYMSQRRGKSMAMVFQDPLSAMTPVYTVGQQISEAIVVHDDCSPAKAMQRAVELLDIVGIAEPQRRVHAYPHEFSGGMRQRAMIAMAIANNPDIIIADEPTTALDVTIQAQVLDVLQKACKELHAAMILITHDLGVVARVADKAIVMYAGKPVEQAPVRTLFKNPAMPYTIGLLGALPSAGERSAHTLSTIPGYPPSPFELPKGCSFAPRCPLVTEQCHTGEPGLLPCSGADHYSACIHREMIAGTSFNTKNLFTNELLTENAKSLSREHDEVAEQSLRNVSATQNTLLELSAVKQHYPLYKGLILRRQIGTVFAVDGIDLQLRESETLALVGESGCGKTTTAMSILDLKQPTEGTIKLFNQNVSELRDRHSRLAVRRQLQIVFQDPMSSLDPRMPVNDLIAEPIAVFNVSPTIINARVRELLTLVGLEETHADRYPLQLSGGQCQRVCIARALALEPRILILDEPVSALDVSIRAGIINLLERLKNSLGLSYLFIAHDLALVRHFADRVAVMYLGQIVESGKVDDVFDNPMHPYTRCLLSVVPVPDPEQERNRELIIPAGELPSPSAPPGGCRFHTRCPVKSALSGTEQKRCEQQVPTLTVNGTGYGHATVASSQTAPEAHTFACHYPIGKKSDLQEI